MSIPPSILPAKRRVHRKRKSAAIASGVLVVSVVALPAGPGYTWTFDTPIESVVMQPFGYFINGSDPGESDSPVGDSVRLYYGDNTVGVPWEIVGSPDGIVFEGGKTIEPGQSGITTG